MIRISILFALAVLCIGGAVAQPAGPTVTYKAIAEMRVRLK